MANNNNNFISSSSSSLIHHGWNDDSKWIDRITKRVQNPIPIDTTEIRPCIFKVPETLVDMKPEAYFPHKVGLGPYHHFRTDLYYLMERRKYNAVQRLLAPTNQVLNSDHNLILKLTEYDDLVRAFYKESCLDLKGEVLAWVIVIDAFFLLDQLRINHRKMLGYIEVTELIKDIIMVENQIPLVLLWTIYRSIQPSYDVEPESANHVFKVQIEQFDFERELQIGIRSTVFAVEHEDVKVLREAEIIHGSLDDDKIVELVDGISKSIDNTNRESYLKKTIDVVNKHFNNRPRVKAGRYMKKCLYTTWKLVVLVASVVTILQLIYKAFCGVYDCDNIFHHKYVAPALADTSLKMFPVQ